MLYRPIRQLADRFNVLQMGIVNSDRVFKLLAREDGIEPTVSGEANQLVKGAIEFQNVWFAYNDEEWVLKDVSFRVEPGEAIAFVGPTGAGKSTIINLLNRFYEHQKGRILIDGVDIGEFPTDVLRTHIGIVLQDVFLFSDSLRNNVTLYAQGVDQRKLDGAADAVGASDFISKLPGRVGSKRPRTRGDALGGATTTHCLHAGLFGATGGFGVGRSDLQH